MSTDLTLEGFYPRIQTRATAGFLAVLLASAAWCPATAAEQRTPGSIFAWGSNDHGQSTLPPEALGSNIIAIADGVVHSLALRQDGTVVAWGLNAGDYLTVPREASDGNVIAISAGFGNSLVLKQDGTVVAWGENGSGQSTVPQGLSGVIAISSGIQHSLALRQDGTVVAWGWDGKAALTVPPEATAGNVIAIAAGGWHSLALKQDGTVIAWAYEDDEAATVPGGLSHVIAIAAGAGHSLALRRDGTVVAWGINYEPGGNGGYTGQAMVPPGLSNVVAIGAAYAQSMALKQDGTVIAWGSDVNTWGTYIGQSTVPDGLSNVLAISPGGMHTLVLVKPVPPTVMASPRSQTAEAGSALRLHVLAGGAPLPSYQWFFNGTMALSGSTNSFLELANVQASQAGSYTVAITNSNGTATSDPAMLSVIPPVPRRAVPAIHLVGEVGSLLHLGYANSVGPGVSFHELDAVGITNASQLYVDRSSPLPWFRFYRAWQSNGSNAKPHLELTLATEVDLTGDIGSKLRLDYINQTGPTDAWVSLDTVTLTNSTQPYVDLTMFGQPARLYRVVQVP